MIRSLSSLLIGAVASTCLWFSCDEPLTEFPAPEYPYAYYPLDSGRYTIYQVDSIIYNETFANDTTSWQVKELVTDTFFDLEDRLNYRIERYRRMDDTEPWQLVNTWHALYSDGKVEKIENNLRFIKLASPLRKDVSWDGNIYLGGLEDIPFDYECNRLSYYEGWDYRYTTVENGYTLGALFFPDVVTVTQQGDSNLIWYDFAREVYARDVGLVFKEFYHYYTQDFSCPTCPWNERVQCGYSVRMQLLEYQ